jgi:hypothetical protein
VTSRTDALGWALLVVMTLLQEGCRSATSAPDAQRMARRAAASDAVSPADLVRSPGRYDGHRVRVRGFCAMAFEGKAIYSSVDDYRSARTRDAVWLDVPLSNDSRAMNERWITAYGVFDASRHGHLQMYGGTLRVERLELFDATGDVADPR